MSDDSNIETDVDRMLTLLREMIRRQGYTQLQVQEKLDWGRSYISQLLTKQKSTRYEQILMILDVIGVEPTEFYAELFNYRSIRRPEPEPAVAFDGRIEDLVQLLVEKGVLTKREVAQLLSD